MTNQPPSLAFALMIMGGGALLVWWGLSAKAIRQQRGVQKKLSVLFSDGLDGSSMRLSMIGVLAIVIGADLLLARFAPDLALGFSLFCWLGLMTLALIALNCKYNPPAKSKKRSERKRNRV